MKTIRMNIVMAQLFLFGYVCMYKSSSRVAQNVELSIYVGLNKLHDSIKTISSNVHIRNWQAFA